MDELRQALQTLRPLTGLTEMRIRYANPELVSPVDEHLPNPLPPAPCPRSRE